MHRIPVYFYYPAKAVCATDVNKVQKKQQGLVRKRDVWYYFFFLYFHSQQLTLHWWMNEWERTPASHRWRQNEIIIIKTKKEILTLFRDAVCTLSFRYSAGVLVCRWVCARWFWPTWMCSGGMKKATNLLCNEILFHIHFQLSTFISVFLFSSLRSFLFAQRALCFWSYSHERIRTHWRVSVSGGKEAKKWKREKTRFVPRHVNVLCCSLLGVV